MYNVKKVYYLQKNILYLTKRYIKDVQCEKKVYYLQKIYYI